MRYLALAFVLLLPWWGYAQPIKVGVYQTPPLIIIDENGSVSGFTVDLLNHIAQEEGWQLEYKAYDFAACLQALQTGEIDLIPALAYSAARDSLFVFNKTSSMINWGKLYKHEADEFNYTSLAQLRGKKIAALKNDHYRQNGEDGLLDLLTELDIPVTWAGAPTYAAVIDSVARGKADLGLVSRYYGLTATADKAVVSTSINLAYVSIRFGLHENTRNVTLAGRLDQQLQALINDKSSFYYQTVQKYTSAPPEEVIPEWVGQTLGIIVAGSTIFVVFILVLQHQVKKQTAELKEINRQLSKSEQEARLAQQTIEASQDIGVWYEPGKCFSQVNRAAIELTGYNENELLQMQPGDLLATNENVAYYNSLSIQNWDGHLRIREKFKKKDGTTLPVELSLDRFTFEGKIYICGFARDITARVTAEDALHEKNKQLNCLYEVSKLIAHRENSIDDILNGTLKALPQAWPNPQDMAITITYGGREYQTANYPGPAGKVAVPIVAGTQEVGLLTVGYSRSGSAPPKAITPEEVKMINAIAEDLGNMIAARDAERRIIASILSTEDKERSRIAKELHDSVGQTLSAISLHLHRLANDRDIPAAGRKKIHAIERLIKTAIAESRSVSHNLMPPSLTDLGYTYAVENLLAAMPESCTLKFNFHSNTAEVDVPKEVEFALYRVTQEAINNSIKHAGATEVTIQYLVFTDLISLSVEDNGKGFALEIANKNHNFGLNSMRSRVASVGGEFTIDTHPGKGTGIHIRVPIT